MLIAICALFFLSGFSALVYEIAWTRLTGLALGNTATAVSSVLAVFLGGLALGALLGGRQADRLAGGHLRLYALLELGVAVVAPAVTFALLRMPRAVAALQGMAGGGPFLEALLRLVMVAALLLPPTVLMGATLPVLIRYLSLRCRRPSHYFGLLYGLNTLGAFAGSMSSCFLGFAYLGVSATVGVASAVNLLVAATAWALGGARPEAAASAGGKGEQTVEPPGPGGPGLLPLCLVAAMSGFTAIGYEVVWTRLIKCYIIPDAYAFAVMVATFLFGLALGSFVYERFFLRAGFRAGGQMSAFAIVQYAVAIACAASLLFLPGAILLSAAWLPSLSPLLGHDGATLAVQCGVSAVYMLLPATIIGIAFPLLGGLASARPGACGRSVGTVYAANTAGCVAGSLAVGLVLIPAAGSYVAFKVLIVSTLATAVAGVAASGAALGRRSRSIFIAAGALMAVQFWLTLSDPYRAEVGADRDGQKLAMLAEDQTGRIMIFTYRDYAQLVVNGQSYASTILKGRRYMRLLGHLPVLVHPCPKDVLNICFGTGTTAGAISIHPQVEHLDVVDLSPVVLASASYFAATNHGVDRQAKVSFHVDDGRNFLLRQTRAYDVVTFEPPPPREAGVVNLYSRDFYALARSRLKPGGILCQWLPMDGESGILWRMMIASARAVFPNVYLFEANDGQGILMAAMAPISIDYDRLKRRMENGAVAESLDAVGFPDAGSLISTFVTSGARLDAYIEGCPPITDDRPALEFFYPYAGERLYGAALSALQCPVSAIVPALAPRDARLIERYMETMKLLRRANTLAERDGDARAALALVETAARMAPGNRFFLHMIDVYAADARAGQRQGRSETGTPGHEYAQKEDEQADKPAENLRRDAAQN